MATAVSKRKSGGLKINRNYGERVFFFIAGDCIGEMVCESNGMEVSALFSRNVVVKREEVLTVLERRAAHLA